MRSIVPRRFEGQQVADGVGNVFCRIPATRFDVEMGEGACPPTPTSARWRQHILPSVGRA